jgi:hypothetical protein
MFLNFSGYRSIASEAPRDDCGCDSGTAAQQEFGRKEYSIFDGAKRMNCISAVAALGDFLPSSSRCWCNRTRWAIEHVRIHTRELSQDSATLGMFGEARLN